jgi:flagellar motor switch protein FliG
MAEQRPRSTSPGLRRAAAIVAMLDSETAVQVCNQLDAETVRLLAAELARMTGLSRQERDAILADFLGALDGRATFNGPQRARELLENVLGRGAAEELGEEARSVRPLEYLRQLDAASIYRHLAEELPQTLAVILSSYLPAERAAAVLSLCPPPQRTEAVCRMASLKPLAPGAMEALAEGLYERIHTAMASKTPLESMTLEFLADVIGNLPEEASRSVLETLHARLPAAAAAVEELIFTFEDVLRLDDRSLQVVLRAVDERTLALAMKKLPDEARERIFSNLSSRAREMLAQEIELLGLVPVREVEAARGRIALTARELAAKGEIVIGKAEELV